MDFKEIFKKLDTNLIVDKIIEENDTIYVYCSTSTSDKCCPYCKCASNKVHSKYTKKLQDLPIQNYKVILYVNAKKYFCVNPDCKKKTFAEQLNFTKPSATRTIRLDEYISTIAKSNSSLDTRKILNNVKVTISKSSIIRILKKKS